ncbi:GntR family transcriptional regulator [Streptosporangium carneum]|uniref:GntR family transcriptional regulator n=1 Tax=Streptosporangium carneum TaxID=47481 RepID=A0A9W6HWH9_9ACTN|nr:GntR family transcriptional regulator [Streptosporangium carneum]GLK06959.1 GntR family transcriptional regulator [Streptosporangium carneum]
MNGDEHESDLDDLDLTPEERDRLTDAQRPLWEIVAASLRADVLEGRYAAGAPLPSETALSARYSVSRPTVRDAVEALVGEGLATVVRGRGTFVRAVPDRYAILLGAWPRHDIANAEFIPIARGWGWSRLPIPFGEDDEGRETYERVDFTPANRDIATALGLSTGHTVFHRYSRWRHAATGLIIGVSSHTVREVLSDRPLNLLKSAYGITSLGFYEALTKDRGPVTWETTVTARMPYADERELMALSVGSPILIIRRTLADKDGRPLEMTEVKADAERFETVYARENPAVPPAPMEDVDLDDFEPVPEKPEHEQEEQPAPEPEGRILLLL